MASRLLLDGFPSRGWEGVMGLLEMASDCVGCHFGRLLVLFGFRSWTGAIQNYDDDDARNRFGEDELRVFSVFRDLYESLGCHYGSGGCGPLFRVQFKLDFYLQVSNKGQN
jgi:hypothetical protein